MDLSKLSLEQLERLKEKAREKQWEDEWWKMYMKKEEERKSKIIREYQGKEKEVITAYNITLKRCGVGGNTRTTRSSVAGCICQNRFFAWMWASLQDATAAGLARPCT